MQCSDHGDGVQKHDKEIKKTNRWPAHFSWMVEYARKLVGSNDAEDIANDALYDVCRTDQTPLPIEDDVEPRRVLRRLLWRRARAHWRKQKRRSAEIPSPIDFDGLVQEDSGTNRSDVTLDRIEVNRILSTLTTTDRELVHAYYVDGFTAEELARSYDMNESTVRSRIARARMKLAKELAECRGQTTRSHGVVFLLEFVRERLSKFVEPTRIRQWIANFVKNGLSVVTYATCLMPLALIPDDASAAIFVKAKAPRTTPIEEQTGIAMKTLTFSDSKWFQPATPEPQRMWLPKKMQLASRPARINVSPEKKQSAIAIVPIAKPISPDQCDNDCGSALGKLNAEKPDECLIILERHLVGSDKCTETIEWSRLHADCQRAISNKQR